MTVPVRDQIRVLGDVIDESQAPLTVAEILSSVDVVSPVPAPVAPPTRSLPRFGVAIVAALAAIALVAVVPLLVSRTDPPAASNDPVPTTVVDTAPTDSSDIDPEAWFTVDWVPATWEGTAPRWITEYPSGGFVAGALGEPARFSSDGVTWTTEPFDDSLRGYRDLYVEGRFALANALPLHDRQPPFTFDEWERSLVPGQTHATHVVWQDVLEYINGEWKPIDVAGHVWQVPVQSGQTIIVFPERDGVGTPHPEYDLFDTRSGSTRYVESLPLPTLAEGYNARPQFAAIPGGFALYDDLGRFHTSGDGLTWTDHSKARPDYTESLRRIRVINLVRQGDDLFAQPYTDRELWQSRDGRRWSRFEEPWVSIETHPRVLHDGNGHLVLTTLFGESTGSSFIAVSPDGSTWLTATNPPRHEGTHRESDIPPLFDPVFEVAHDRIFFIETQPDGSASIKLGTLPIASDRP